ncbi:MAG: efflux RND transporter periplasmic adaptor subunit [Candidatus Lernaella stagnicola]|nr:efflux RND transporter periplasmic adaptor subunit [Candidatus Lernaella stagnicola]
MKRAILIAVLALVVALALIQRPAPAEEAGTLYTCPMHPHVVQDEPGVCPICHMDLVPMKDTPTPDDAAGMDTHEDHATDSAKKSIVIDPVTVQNMGMRVEHVERGDLTRTIRTLGEIDVAEDALSVVNLRFSGWVEQIYVDETGMSVKAGQPLFRIYSPDLVQAQEEFLQALTAAGTDAPLTESARTKLDLLMGGSWLSRHLEKTMKPIRSVSIPSPQSGFVLHKNVVRGSQAAAGQDLYRIGNLTKIWANVEVYEFDAPWIKPGQSARMELSFQKGKRFEGKVDYVYPTLNPQSRTLRARLVFPNPGLNLKPGMFATVWIDVEAKKNVLAVPTEAILYSGERQLVFVSTGGGKYSAREVVTGLTGNDHRTEILSGLEAGEVVVTSGQFLLDSESQLQEAVEKLLTARLEAKKKSAGDDENAGHDHNAMAADSYWRCPMHPEVVQDEPGQCPICKMDLVEKKK